MSLGRTLAGAVRWFQRWVLVELVCLGFAVLLSRQLLDAFGPWSVACAAVLGAVLALRLVQVWGRVTPRRVSEPGQSREVLQVELLLVCAVFLLLRWTGGLDSPLYPMLYLLLAVTGGTGQRLVGVLTIAGVAGVLEVLSFVADGRTGWPLLAVHLVAVGLFPGLVSALTRTFVRLHRELMVARLAEERLRVEQDAALYRMGGGAAKRVPLSDEKQREYREKSSARELQLSVGNLLAVARGAFRADTVALYLLSADEKSLNLHDADVDPARPERKEALASGAIPAGEGILGAVIKNNGPVSVNHIRDSAQQLTYYRSRVPVKTLLSVPVFEAIEGRRYLRCILVADRVADIPFGQDDEELLTSLGREVWRTFATERLLADMDSTFKEYTLFSDSSTLLNRAVNQQEVVGWVLDTVHSVFPGVDLAAVVLQDIQDPRRYALAGVKAGDEFEAWREANLQSDIQGDDNLCLLAMKNGHPMPPEPFHKRHRDKRSIFGPQMTPAGLESVRVYPLKVAASRGGKSDPGEDKVLGALVAASRARDFFPGPRPHQEDRKERMLKTLSDIAAVALQGAQRFEQLERLATTDGLTGLHNHRRFQEMLEAAVAEALRYRHPLSMILSDVDHFKRVNDTHGHPVGDEVLKRVARVLGELARTTDRVCRYGGEEFAVIMPQTDAAGAQILAERFREEIKKQRFRAGGTEFHVTISLGICTVPETARHKQELIDRADQALYHAKHSGRDRSVHFADLGQGADPGSHA